MFSSQSYRDAQVSLLFQAGKLKAQSWKVRCRSLPHGLTQITPRRATQPECISVFRADAGLDGIELIEEAVGGPGWSFKVEGIAPILMGFLVWMRTQRGVTDQTLSVYRRVLEEFLTSHGTDPGSYSAEVLRTFVLKRGKRHGISYAKLGATAVRTFARFLTATNQCPAGLEYAIPAWTSRNHSSMPTYLIAKDVERVVRASTMSEDPLRNKAIILLLARLGLRAGDIVSLHLTHVDWENARILLCGKGRRQEYLPLSQEVGNALLRYIKRERPATSALEVFIRSMAPFRRLTYQAVGNVVRTAINQAGVASPSCGAHVLRHSAATTMLRQGVSLVGIGAVLRHRSPSTTTRYAKVDHGLLSEIAKPWPEVTSC